MSEPIYYSKIEFQEGFSLSKPRKIISINLIEQEFALQILKWPRHGVVIEHFETDNSVQGSQPLHYGTSGVFMGNAHTDFNSKLLPYESNEPAVLFAYSEKISKARMNTLKLFCDATEFEPYRSKNMFMEDSSCIGYRDTATMQFIGITDSPIPIIHLPMNILHDIENEWPHERLYRHIITAFFKHNSAIKKWASHME